MSERASRRNGSFFSRFGRSESGVSAVEFALLAPVMILIWFGLAEFCQGFMAQKRMGHATSQVADIIAQGTQTNTDLISDTFAIGTLIMDPFPADTLSLRVSSVTRGADGVARVAWSQAEGTNFPARDENSVMTIPDGLIDNGQTIIVSESRYSYTSAVQRFIPDAIEFSHIYYLRPRLVSQIDCADC